MRNPQKKNILQSAFIQPAIACLIVVSLLFLFDLSTAHAAITFVRSNSDGDTDVNLDIGSAETNRLVVIIFDDESEGTNLSAVTVDGKSATLVTIAENNAGIGNHQEMWYIDENDLGTSNGTVTISGTGGDNGWAIHAYLFTGVAQSGPNDVGIDNTSISPTGTVTVANIDCSANGLVIMGAGAGDNVNPNGWTAPLTQQVIAPDPSSASLFSAYGIEVAAQTNKTYQHTWSSAPNRGTAIVATWDEGAVDLDQIHYRWREDDGNESTASNLAAEDAKLVDLEKNDIVRLRFEVSNEGNMFSYNNTFQLQVAETDNPLIGVYAAVPTDTSSDFQIIDSTYITDGTTSTNVGSVLTDENTDFLGGELKDAGNTTSALTVSGTEFIEIEFSIQATTNSTYETNYYFRLYNAADAAVLDTYSEYAAVSIAPYSGPYVWDGGGGDNNWTTPNNWDIDHEYPDASNDWAIFNVTSNIDCTVDQAVTVRSVDIDDLYTGTITQSVDLTLTQDMTLGSGAAFDTATSDLTIAGSITITGTLDGSDASSTIFIGKNFDSSGGTFTAGDGTLEFYGASNSTMQTAGEDFDELIINKTSTLYNLSVSDTLSVGGDFLIKKGVFYFDNDLTLNGNLTVSSGGEFRSYAQGKTIFFNNSDSVGYWINTGGVITLIGNVVNLIYLRSDVDGQQWDFYLSGNRAILYVDVQDSDASGGKLVAPTNSTDTGNNDNWFPITAHLIWDSGGGDDDASTNLNWNPDQVPGNFTVCSVDTTNDNINWDVGTIWELTTSGTFGGNLTQSTNVTISSLFNLERGTWYVDDYTFETQLFTVDTNGTFELCDGTLTITQTFDVLDGTFVANLTENNLIYFSTDGGGKTIRADTLAADIYLKASSGSTWTLQNDLVIEGDLTIGSGVLLDLDTYDLTVTGNIWIQGGLDASSSTEVWVGKDLDITGGSYFSGSETLFFYGAHEAVVTSGGNAFYNVEVIKGPDSWWNSSWTYRQPVGINNDSQRENLTNFPMLVTLDSTRINYDHVQDAGQDLRFYDANDSTALDFEIEDWNESGTSYIWVEVPQIDGATDSDYVLMYYGNSGAADGQDVNGTWEGNFETVYHLHDNFSDSTANGNTATNNGSSDITGKIADAQDFDSAGSDYLASTSNLRLWLGGGTPTVSAWIKTTQVGNNTMWQAPGLTGTEQSGGGNDIFWGWIDGSGYINFQSANDSAHNVTSSNAINDNAWHYVTMTRNTAAGEYNMYVDGVLNDNSTGGDTTSVTTDFSSVGRIEDTGGSPVYYDGIIDEFRISSTIRSADWIAASYKTMTDSFSSLGKVVLADALQTANNVTITRGIMDIVSHDLTVAGDLDVNDLLDGSDSSSHIWVGGDLDFTGGNFAKGGGGIHFYSANNTTFTPAGEEFDAITIEKPSTSYSVTVDQSLSMSGDFLIEGGMFISTNDLTMNANLTVYSGAEFRSTAAGYTIFFNNTDSVGYWVNSGATITLTGVFGNEINLLSDVDGSQWDFFRNGTRSISYVYVKDSDASGGTTVGPSNSVDAGNNLNWWPSSSTAFMWPNAAAPGMAVVVQFIGAGYADASSVQTSSADIVVGPIVTTDTTGVYEAAAGNALTTVFFIAEDATDGVINVTVDGNSVTPDFEIITPAAGSGDFRGDVGPFTLGDDTGDNGDRTVGGTIVLENLYLPSGETASVDLSDMDAITVGNQGYLPAFIVVSGEVSISGTLNVDGSDATLEDAGAGGPGGGGGGGGGANEPTGGADLGGFGGDGFAGGGGGSTRDDAVNGRAGDGGDGSGEIGESAPAGDDIGGDGGDAIGDTDDDSHGTTGGNSAASNGGGGGGGGGTGFVFGTGGQGYIGAPPAAGLGGGGGGEADSNSNDGAGGGFGTNGTDGNGSDGPGVGGEANGNDQLVPWAGGSGGGGGGADNNTSGNDRKGGGGGGGGGSCIIFTNNELTVSGTITASGGDGGDDTSRGAGGGGGSGGGIVLMGSTVYTTGATLTATGGVGGSGVANNGEAGGDGRVRVDGVPAGGTTIQGTVSGSSTEFTGPSIVSINDSTEVITGTSAASANIDIYVTYETTPGSYATDTFSTSADANGDWSDTVDFRPGNNYITVIQKTSAGNIRVMGSGSCKIHRRPVLGAIMVVS